ncbi:MAG: hypothetical protein KJI71_02940 [Patescibacteria group bacterium]|nr:hypothetical protein [Patescibacteria group bacterium]
MPKLKTIKIKDIKGFLKKLPLILAEKTFFAFLGLFVLSLIFGGIIYYRYTSLTRKIEPGTIEEQFKFKSETYDLILETWKEREEKFRKTDQRIYPDLFVR